MDFAVFDLHRDGAQMLATARAGDAEAIRLIESGAMHGADERVVLEKKLAWRIVEPTRCMRTDIEIGMHLLTMPQQDHALFAIGQRHVDGGGAAIGNFFQPA
jgi:hypothetical protein